MQLITGISVLKSCNQLPLICDFCCKLPSTNRDDNKEIQEATVGSAAAKEANMDAAVAARLSGLAGIYCLK